MAHRVLYLTNWTQHEPKRDSRPKPAIFQNAPSALKVEHVSAVQLGLKKQKNKQEVNITLHYKSEVRLLQWMGLYLELLGHLYSRSCRKSLCEANHAHVISILFQATCALVTTVQTWEAGLLIFDSSTGVSTRMGFTAGLLCILLNETWEKLVLYYNKKMTESITLFYFRYLC